MQKAIALVVALCPLTLLASDRVACPVPGRAIQWIADYCMYTEQTDDVVAAGACIDRKQARSGTDDCATRLRYKTRLCKLHIADGTRQGSLEACISDAAFSGNIVRNGH